MSVESRVEIFAGHLVRNYLAALEHPVSEKGFTLTFYKVCKRLREEGIYPAVGFKGEVDPSKDPILDNDLWSPSISDEYHYWTGHRFLQHIGYDYREGQVWFMPEEKRLGFYRDLEWVNKGLSSKDQDTLKQIIAESDQKVFAESIASHPLITKLIELQTETDMLATQIFCDPSSNLATD